MFYMPEGTVQAAKLHNKSLDELRKMGIGRDDNGFYLLATVSIPTPKTGILATARAVVKAAEAALNVVKAQIGEKASAEVVAYREEICRTCYEVDSAGQRLFRFYDVDKVSCGQPMDPTASDSKLLRDPVVDGCGCWLKDKWASRDQACPRGKWGPEPPKAKTIQSASKSRCCGRR